MPDKPMNHCDSLSQEAGILDILKSHKLKNPKKLCKLAQRLLEETQFPIQRELLMDILRARDPIAYLNDCEQRVTECTVIVKQFIDDGCHGMILTGPRYTVIYPIKLQTMEKWLDADDMWSPEDELDIKYKAVKAWMEEHEAEHFHGKALLFPQFGFSGLPELITMDRRIDTDGLDKIDGTDFFFDPTVKG